VFPTMSDSGEISFRFEISIHTSDLVDLSFDLSTDTLTPHVQTCEESCSWSYFPSRTPASFSHRLRV